MIQGKQELSKREEKATQQIIQYHLLDALNCLRFPFSNKQLLVFFFYLFLVKNITFVVLRQSAVAFHD